jgi:dihydroneopterin aldolase
MDMYIELKEMIFYAYHGVSEQERKVGNTYLVDLKLQLDFSPAMQTDDLNDTINYAAVYDLVKKEMDIPSNLLEHIAGRIIKRIAERFPAISCIEIRLAKQNPPIQGEMKESAVYIKQNSAVACK